MVNVANVFVNQQNWRFSKSEEIQSLSLWMKYSRRNLINHTSEMDGLFNSACSARKSRQARRFCTGERKR